MANRAGVATLVLAATVTLSGCGTTMNLIGYQYQGPLDLTPRLSPKAVVYGGVIMDAAILAAGSITHVVYKTLPTWEEAGVVSLLLLDLPLSAIGDTLTLPLTAYVGLKRLTAEPTPSDGPPEDL